MEEKNERLPYVERAAKLFCALVWGGFLWATVRYAQSVLTVLLLAWGMAAVVHPIAVRVSERTKLPRKACAAGIWLLLLLGVCTLGAVCIHRLSEELTRLLAWVRDNRAELAQELSLLLDTLSEGRIPFLSELSADGEWQLAVQRTWNSWLNDAAANLGALLTAGVGRVIVATPKAFLMGIAALMASLYACMDYDALCRFGHNLLEKVLGSRTTVLRTGIGRAIRLTLRAHLILMLLTFGEVWFGLTVLGVRYSLLLALLISVVDVLPILGAGTVLVPWALLSLLFHRTSLGIGLLLLYGIVTVVRQIAEPHILGDSLGIHPLASLLSMLLGLELFGVWGLLLAPIAVMLIKNAGNAEAAGGARGAGDASTFLLKKKSSKRKQN